MFIEYGQLSAKMYEETKPVGASLNGDLEYYYTQLKETRGKILEAGVGNGRLMIPYLQKGLAIEGVDLSEEMLAQCRINMEKADVSGKVFQGDLTNLDLPEKYAAIMMPTGSFCLLPRKSVSEVLRSFHEHLEEKGRLILDLELPSWYEKNELDIRQVPLDERSGIIFTGLPEKIDWHQQKTAYIHKYELLRDGVVEQTEVSHFELYWYGIEEFTILLEKAGFAEIRHEVGYGKNPEDSLITFIASKN